MTIASVTRVSAQRWEEAQAWEAALWDRNERLTGWRRLLSVGPLDRLLGVLDRGPLRDDWNRWWAQRFDNYAFLPDRLGAVVEVGCGPYTNIRLITQGRNIHRIVCSDPLIERYLRYRRTWLRDGVRRGLIEVDPHPLEESSLPDEAFDLVVMINVLDHVQDASLCIRRAVQLLAPGGFLIVGQDLSDRYDAQLTAGDVGHPIKLHEDDIRPQLLALDPVMDLVLPREEGRNPSAHYGTLLYVGRNARGDR